MRRYHRVWNANKGNRSRGFASGGSRFFGGWIGDACFRFRSSSGQVLKSVPVVLAGIAVWIFIFHLGSKETDVSSGAGQNWFCNRSTGADSKKFFAVEFQRGCAIRPKDKVLLLAFPRSRVWNFRAACCGQRIICRNESLGAGFHFLAIR